MSEIRRTKPFCKIFFEFPFNSAFAFYGKVKAIIFLEGETVNWEKLVGYEIKKSKQNEPD